jgi:hypothetical protein
LDARALGEAKALQRPLPDGALTIRRLVVMTRKTSRRMNKAVDIETVSQCCGVSVATIRKTYRHVMPGTFDSVMAAPHNFGR